LRSSEPSLYTQEMEAAWPDTARLPVNVATSLADRLEEAIVTGGLAPGTPLLQLELAAEFGVSRVPVRDALAILERRHLAVRVPRRGVVVRPVTRRSVQEVYSVTRLMEGELTRLAAVRITDAQLDELRRIVGVQRAASAAQDIEAARDADRAFHGAIWRAADHEMLAELMDNVWRRAMQARAVAHRTAGWIERSIVRHELVLGALAAHDPERAVHHAAGAFIAAEDEILAHLDAAAPTQTEPPGPPDSRGTAPFRPQRR
jgi:DNA-binding GntR family transcriptional regulator